MNLTDFLPIVSHRFLTSYPPFHASTPEQVFDNILSRRINWHEDEVEMSAEARDFIDRLLCFDPSRRLGAHGAEEVKRHPWLRGIDWQNIRTMEANFVPQVADPESTDYFDARGATSQVFEDDPAMADAPQRPLLSDSRANSDPANLADARKAQRDRPDQTPADDFGAFSFKNLDVLKQANDEVIRKLRNDQLIPSSPPESGMQPPRAATSTKPKSEVCRRPAPLDLPCPKSSTDAA